MISNAMTILSIWTTMICKREDGTACLTDFLSRGLESKRFLFFFILCLLTQTRKNVHLGTVKFPIVITIKLKFHLLFFQRSLTLSTVIQQFISSAAFQIKKLLIHS